MGDVTFLDSAAGTVGRFQELEDGWRQFETQQFTLEIPPGFKYVESAPPDTRSLGNCLSFLSQTIHATQKASAVGCKNNQGR